MEVVEIPRGPYLPVPRGRSCDPPVLTAHCSTPPSLCQPPLYPLANFFRFVMEVYIKVYKSTYKSLKASCFCNFKPFLPSMFKYVLQNFSFLHLPNAKTACCVVNLNLCGNKGLCVMFIAYERLMKDPSLLPKHPFAACILCLFVLHCPVL